MLLEEALLLMEFIPSLLFLHLVNLLLFPASQQFNVVVVFSFLRFQALFFPFALVLQLAKTASWLEGYFDVRKVHNKIMGEKYLINVLHGFVTVYNFRWLLEFFLGTIPS
jgi:hypothetical protein